MALHAPRTSAEFELCPAGSHVAVCCDVVDLGPVKGTDFNGQPIVQHKVQIRWQIRTRMATTGKPYLVQKRYTFSMHEKANLRKDVNSWRGRPFTDAEADAFDFERLVGKLCYLNVIHNARPRGTYADVVAIMPVPPGTPPLAVDGYLRVKDRPTDATAAQPVNFRSPGAQPVVRPEPPIPPPPGWPAPPPTTPPPVPAREPGDEWDSDDNTPTDPDSDLPF